MFYGSYFLVLCFGELRIVYAKDMYVATSGQQMHVFYLYCCAAGGGLFGFSLAVRSWFAVPLMPRYRVS